MSWQVGTTLLGFGVAIFLLVAPMLGVVLPRWLLMLLLGFSILLICAWPLSWVTTLISSQKIRTIVFIGFGIVLGGLVFGIIGYNLQDQEDGQVIAVSNKTDPQSPPPASAAKSHEQAKPIPSPVDLVIDYRMAMLPLAVEPHTKA